MLTYYKNATLPVLQVTLSEYKTETDTQEVDLRGATVSFYMKEKSAGSNKVNGAACRLLDPENGLVRYEWATADLNTVGTYTCQFKVVFADGAVEWFDQFIIQVVESL